MTENTVLDNNVSSIIKKENYIPKLRFSEFDSEYKILKLGNILKVYHGKDYKHLKHGIVPVLGTGGIITYVNESLCNWSCALIGRKGSIDKPQYMNIPFWSVDTLFYTKPKEHQNPKYQYYLFNTINWKKYDESTGVPSLSANTIENITVTVPSDIKEQEKIVKFLDNIDNIISTQESNISILETYNRGLISQIFKQEIKFKDNNENDYPEWKSKKLGDCVTVKRGSSPRPIEKYITNDDNGINWIKIGDAPIDGNIITEVKEKITIEGAGKSRRVYVGDLILSNSMSFGRPYILEVDGCIHDGWLLIRDERNIFDLKYLCYLLNSEEVIRQYGMYAAGSTVNNLNSELVQSVKIQLPCLKEQQKIADCLSAIDKVVEQEKVYLEQLKTIKKGLLQQMFV